MTITTERFALVPAWILTDPTVSRDARWLFGLMASHADDVGNLRRSLTRIAAAEGVSVRTVERWMLELEHAGYVVRKPRPGRASEYQIIRHRELMPKAKQVNARNIDERLQILGPAGRKGAARRAEGRKSTPDTSVAPPPTPVSPAPDRNVGGTRDTSVAPPPTPVSPRTYQGGTYQGGTDHSRHIPLSVASGPPSGQNDRPDISITDPPFLIAEPTASTPVTPIAPTKTSTTTIATTATPRRRAAR